MKRFKLPEILGGIEVEEVGDQVYGVSTAVQTLMSHITVEVPGVGLMRIARDQLTEVKPPLPPEPDAPAVMLGGHVWTRCGFVCDYYWEAPGFHALSWLALNQMSAGVPIVPLVPDPVASAPELPLVTDEVCINLDRIDGEVVLGLGDFDSGGVLIEGTVRYAKPDEAERIAYAVLRAAREARAAS